jgi:GDP-D-mannose 3',5'-epimerase
LVAGGGGFIGGHLVARLLEEGYDVRAVDVRPLNGWEQRFADAENVVADLRDPSRCEEAVAGCEAVYNLACDMGGIGFIESNKLACMLSVLVSTHLIDAASRVGVDRYFFASSACVYPTGLQQDADVNPLAEATAYPADPEDGYGWEKLFSERMARHVRDERGLETRVARYHNVYGPFGYYRGGREKAPAALCRKVIEARRRGQSEIEIWGDGKQVRTFTYVSDCIEGTRRITDSDVAEPLNVGSEEAVTIDELVDMVEDIAGVRLLRRYNLDAPQGVRGRSSDNEAIRAAVGWQPTISLREGLELTYRWIFDELVRPRRRRP